MNTISSGGGASRRLSRVCMLSILLAGTAACADRSPVAEDDGATVAAVATTADDGDWIRLDGTIVSTTPSSFVLDYGADTITVEADDWDISQEGLGLLAGDRVSVSGRVDDNVFARDTIEASAIYLTKLDTVYYANSADEEQFGLSAIPSDTKTDGVDYTGWVTDKTGNGFTLGAGVAKIAVDTSGLDSKLAETGIETGDRVYVWGDFNLTDNGKSALSADGLVELVDSKGKAPGAGQASGDGKAPVDGKASDNGQA